MVRVGGVSYVLDPTAAMGRRIGDMTLARTGAPIEPGRDYAVAGWASINQATEGPPIWEVVERHLAHHKVVRPDSRARVRIAGY